MCRSDSARLGLGKGGVSLRQVVGRECAGGRCSPRLVVVPGPAARQVEEGLVEHIQPVPLRELVLVVYCPVHLGDSHIRLTEA